MLTVDRLSKLYAGDGGNAGGGVAEASFDLEPGTFFTLLGPSGCGKTTTLRCIAGLERPDAGTIKVDGQMFFDRAAGTEVPMNLRRIGMVFQSYAIWPHMTVFENVAFPLRVAKDRRYDRAELARLVDEALATVGLTGFGGRPATRLSGGQQQRVALARAIVLKPKLMLLDEPLSNLDAALREEMRNELRRLQKQIGVTTVYVTHDQTEALEMSDRIAVMEKGRIVQMGTPQQIYFEPRNAFVARFVGSSNWLQGVVVGPGADGMVEVRLGDGGVVRCRGEAAVNNEVKIAIRPESVMLRQAGAVAAAGFNHLPGIVRAVDFLGSSSRYQIDVGSAFFQAHGAAPSQYGTGDRVTVEFAAGNAMVLPE